MPDNSSLVVHPTQPLVLLVSSAGGWALPAHEAGEAPAIRREMRERFGLDATVLGIAGGRYLDADHDAASTVFALELHGTPGPLPAGARWAGPADLAQLELAAPEHGPLIAERLHELSSGGAPPQRVPWARRGWFDSARAWMQQHLDRLGYVGLGPVEQVRIRSWSAVLHAPTSAGGVYFKAVAPAAAFEVPLTTTLAEVLPAQTPRVLAADAARHWLLMADAGDSLGPALRAGGASAPYEAALHAFAQFQQATMPHVERLVSLGCPDRRLHRLPALFQALVADRDALLLGQADGLSEPDYARLKAMAPEVEALCAHLAAYQLPAAALHHDEITPGHVIPSGDRYIFFDWGDSAITHPLCSLMMALRWARLVLGYDAAALAGLRDAYLAAWTADEPLERLREAYAIAARLALLCRALTWHAFIQDIEPAARWQCDDSAAYFLGLFLNGED